MKQKQSKKQNSKSDDYRTKENADSKDDKYYELFDTLESLEEYRIALTTAMKEGFMSMTSARFEYGKDAVAPFHIPTDREQEALVKVKLQQQSSSEYTNFHLVKNNTETKTNNNEEKRKEEKDEESEVENETGENQPSLLDYETEIHLQKKDPALWYGVKPYRYMSSAKSHFEKALSIAVELCNLQQKMRQRMNEL